MLAARLPCTAGRVEISQPSSREGMRSSFFGSSNHGSSQRCPLRSQPLVSRSLAGRRGVFAMAAPAKKGKGTTR